MAFKRAPSRRGGKIEGVRLGRLGQFPHLMIGETAVLEAGLSEAEFVAVLIGDGKDVGRLVVEQASAGYRFIKHSERARARRLTCSKTLLGMGVSRLIDVPWMVKGGRLVIDLRPAISNGKQRP